jgi:hypothetical protein
MSSLKNKKIEVWYNAELDLLTTIEPEPGETICLFAVDYIWFYIGEL